MVLFLLVTTVWITTTAHAAAPVGQTIWIRAAATGLFVSADQSRGTWAPLVADRSTTAAWEQFQVVDAGGGFIAFRSIGTGLFVSADQARAPYAPLVADRPTISTWEQFTWLDLAGGAFTLRGRVTNRFVSADLNRGAFAPLVPDRTAAGAWEQFTWGAAGTQPPAGAPPGFSRLVWSDEFSSSSINAANWGFDIGNNGWGNNELQNYTNRTQNARIENGMLVIEARRESLGGGAFTSARLKTQGKQSVGINTWVEARTNAPEGQGVWPAFWMLVKASARLVGRLVVRSTSWRFRARIRLETSVRFTGPKPAASTFRLEGFSIRRVRFRQASIPLRFHVPEVQSSGTSIEFSMPKLTSPAG